MGRTLTKVLGLLVVSLFFGVTSFATPVRLQLTNGATTINVVSLTGEANYQGSVGNWEINITSGVGSGALHQMGSLDLVSANINSTGAGDPGTLTITFSELNIDFDYPAFDITVGGTNRRSSVAYFAYYDNTNSYLDDVGASPVLLGSLGTYSGTGSFSGATIGTASTSGNYSLSQVLVVNAVSPFPGNNFSVNAHISPVPEPSALLLLGSGLLTFAISRRRGSSAKV